MADTNGDTFWKWATGVLLSAVAFLWRVIVKKDDQLIREKESRILDKDKSIARLESFERKAREAQTLGRTLAAKRRRGKDRKRNGRKSN